MAEPLVEMHDLANVDEVFDAIVVGKKLRYESAVESPWAFRGQCAPDPLLPSALRPGARLLDEHGRWVEVAADATYAERARFEMNTLRAFFLECDRNGLHVPGDSVTLRTGLWSLVDELRDRSEPWPPTDLLPLMAVAQHHGIPTRLLDWTRDPSVALYFAAHGASCAVAEGLCVADEVRDLDAAMAGAGWGPRFEGRYLYLWAFNLRLASLAASKQEQAQAPHVRIVVAPRAGNENLYAQHGVFTIPAESGDNWESGSGKPIPLEELVARWQTTGGHGPYLVRFRLPLRCGPELLARIIRSGTTAARLFPGFDGVVRALRDRSYVPGQFRDPPF